MAAEVLFEGCGRHGDIPGLKIVRNERNRFVIASLYYWADPAKTSPSWEAEARCGMSDAQFRKEYLIDYTALFGEKVFPELSAGRNAIVLPADIFDWDATAGACWAGLDFGLRNPSAFEVFTYHDGCWYAIWELYEPCRNIEDFTAKLKACPFWNRIRYIAADPSMKHERGYRRDGSPCSIRDSFMEHGIKNLIMAPNDEPPFITTIRGFWRDPTAPRFCITDACPKLLKEFDEIVYSGPTQSEATLANKAYKDSMVDYNNHALDATKYFFNSNPNPKAVSRSLAIPNMANWWKH